MWVDPECCDHLNSRVPKKLSGSHIPIPRESVIGYHLIHDQVSIAMMMNVHPWNQEEDRPCDSLKATAGVQLHVGVNELPTDDPGKGTQGKYP